MLLLGQPQQGWQLARDGNWPGMSASQQDPGIGILVNVMRAVKLKLLTRLHTDFLSGEKKLLTPVLFPSWRGLSHAPCFLFWTEGWYYPLPQAVWVFLGSRSAVYLGTCFHRIMVTQLRI